MGLDMYLTRTYKFDKKKVKVDFTASRPPKNIDINQKNATENIVLNISSEYITELQESVGYWRKAHSIHEWFVENVQKGEDDCGEYVVPIEKIKELKKLCYNNFIKQTGELLPEKERGKHVLYLEGYLEDVRKTMKICDQILSDHKSLEEDFPELETEITYRASW